MQLDELRAFYQNRKVFVTGHTGFKGTWLCMLLKHLGASVYGYSLAPSKQENIFDILNISDSIHHTVGDVRDSKSMEAAYKEANPEVVFHLAAQPLVIESYKAPRYTYETNVMGTVNILECIRNNGGATSFVNITTDKVYKNLGLTNHSFKEDEYLDGFDPYSNSKSCSELVTDSYRNSFFMGKGNAAISTARAGNVIGGGDFSENRIIPDCARSVIKGNVITVRNPNSIRPYQHVLEPLYAYLLIAMRQENDKTYSGCYNVGPHESGCITTKRLVELFCGYWGEGASWVSAGQIPEFKEAECLKLDCSKIRATLGWQPKWNIEDAVEKTVEWYRAFSKGMDIKHITIEQIESYFA